MVLNKYGHQHNNHVSLFPSYPGTFLFVIVFKIKVVFEAQTLQGRMLYLLPFQVPPYKTHPAFGIPACGTLWKKNNNIFPKKKNVFFAKASQNHKVFIAKTRRRLPGKTLLTSAQGTTQQLPTLQRPIGVPQGGDKGSDGTAIAVPRTRVTPTPFHPVYPVGLGKQNETKPPSLSQFFGGKTLQPVSCQR